MKKHIFFTLIGLLILNCSASAQFRVDRKEVKFAFEPVKKFSYHLSRHFFSRVEGVALQGGVTTHPLGNSLAFTADISYGTSISKPEDAFRYRVSGEIDVELKTRVTFGGRYFNWIDSNDDWVNTDYDNSLAGLFAHTDFRDWFGHEGVLGYADVKVGETHTLRFELGQHEYEVLDIEPAADWSLFSWAHDEKFAPNSMRDPLLKFMPGEEQIFRLIGVLDNRDNPIFPMLGLHVESIYEKTTGDFETDGLFVTARYYRLGLGNQRMQTKLMFGSRSGSAAAQHSIGFGGIATLRGYKGKSFVGDRAMHGAFNYFFGGDVLQRLPLSRIPLYDTFSLGLFFDAGLAWYADPLDPNTGLFEMGEFETGDLRTSLGFSLLIAEGFGRLDFAKTTDAGGEGWHVYFHLLGKL